MMMGASIFHFARGLAARNFFSGSDMRGFVWQQLKFRLGGEGSPERRPRPPRAGAVLRRRSARGRARRARRGDLRRADGRPHLGGHPRPGPDAPRRRPAGLARHRHARRAGAHHRRAASASPARWARSPRARTASSPAASSASCCTARPRPHAVRALAGPRGPRPAALRGLLRLGQRRPDAVRGGHRGGRQPGLRPAPDRPAARLGDPRLPVRPQGRPHRRAVGAGRGRRGRARWSAGAAYRRRVS